MAVNPGTFVIQEDGTLMELVESPYDSEVLLQELPAKYPNLLAGDQINTTSPRLLGGSQFGHHRHARWG